MVAWIITVFVCRIFKNSLLEAMCQLHMDITDPGYQFATTKRTFIFTNASENLVTCYGNMW